MFRRFARHIRDGFIGVIRHIGLSISSATAVSITLILISFFLLVSNNITAISKNIEQSISISVLLKDKDESVEKRKEIAAKIAKELKKINGVVKTDYRSKEDEFNFYLATAGDIEINEFYENYRTQNPFNDCILVEIGDGTLIGAIKTAAEKIDGVESVHDGGSSTYLLVDFLAKARLAGSVMALVLGALACYLIYNTINATIASRKDEIWIMRNVGARNGYIRAPFLVEGIIIGAVGALLPLILSVLAYLYFYNYVDGALFGAFPLLYPWPYLYHLSGILLAIGVGVGFIGSYFSVVKYLRYRR